MVEVGNFKFIETKIPDLYIVEPKVFGDARGYFMESYNKQHFDEAGLTMTFVQDNESRSKKGVLRGLHFQTQHTQGKLVRCTEGEVWDVAVDLRKDSPTLGKYVMAELSDENKRQFFIPRGFAHGFLVLSDEAIFTYKVDNVYAPQSEAGIRWDDETIGIEWPIDMNKVITSEKDNHAAAWKDAELF